MSASGFVAFERLAVLGLGLLGGSTARAARSRGVARETLGYARRRGPLETAVAAGTIDRFGDLAEVVGGADLVVLGTPIAAMERVLERAAPYLAPGTIVTDVGSVKGDLARALPALLPEGVQFVGSHPMAGSHRAGAEHADAELFVGRCVVVTPIESTDERTCERISDFWAALGARVVRRDPDAHDAQVAWTSHLPHLLAYAFSHALEHMPSPSKELVGAGFQDFTRIAHSGPDLWADILTTNGKALVGPLQHFSESLSQIAQAAEAGDPEALERVLAAAGETLMEVAAHAAPRCVAPMRENARSGGTSPEIHPATDVESSASRRKQRNQHE